MRFSRRDDTIPGPNVISAPHYLHCKLHNATYTVKFTWLNGIQTLRILDPAIGDSVTYLTNTSAISFDREDLAYSAFMWATSNQLTGSMGFYRDRSLQNSLNGGNNTAGMYSRISTDIDRTSLLGSSKFNTYFLKDHALSGNLKPGETFSAQRLQDMAFARHQKLERLSQELSSNITMSLIGNPLLSYVFEPILL